MKRSWAAISRWFVRRARALRQAGGKRPIWATGLLCIAASFSGHAAAAQSRPLVFLSTQAGHADEAVQMRQAILADAPSPVDFVPVDASDLPARIAAGHGTGPKVDVIGALHGDLLPLAAHAELMPLDDLAARLSGGGVPDPLLMLGRLGMPHQFYIPWMQAGYVMVADKRALPYLPPGADIDALSYDQLAAWAAAIEDKTGKRLLGFPAGPQGLIARFFEGFLSPSYTGGVVVPFRSADAEAMWRQFAMLWRHVNPSSTTYDSVQEALLSGDVWIGFGHVARLLPLLRAKPDAFVTFPAPAGPRGRGYAPILVGVAIAKGADFNRSVTLIDYLRQPATQLAAARGIGFFPVVAGASLQDLEPGFRMAGLTLEKMRSAPDARLTLLPIGLGDKSAAFDKVFTDTFAEIVLHGEAPRPVLDREATVLQRIFAETDAHCWRPDPPSTGPCQIK